MEDWDWRAESSETTESDERDEARGVTRFKMRRRMRGTAELALVRVVKIAIWGCDVLRCDRVAVNGTAN